MLGQIQRFRRGIVLDIASGLRFDGPGNPSKLSEKLVDTNLKGVVIKLPEHGMEYGPKTIPTKKARSNSYY
jgi:hypothetical protein